MSIRTESFYMCGVDMFYPDYIQFPFLKMRKRKAMILQFVFINIVGPATYFSLVLFGATLYVLRDHPCWDSRAICGTLN